MKLKLNENNYIIAYAEIGDFENSIEYNDIVPIDFEENYPYYKLENEVLVFDAELKQNYIDKEVIKIEKIDLENWFDWYDIQCNQYRRCVELGIEYDKDIMALHQQAEINALRLNEIKAISAP
jgi:hypothetical protein